MQCFDPISSAGVGKRDLFVDFSEVLEETEKITTTTVTPSNTALFTSTTGVVNTEEIEGTPIGKGVGFSVTTADGVQAKAELAIRIEGDMGTQDTHNFGLPIKHRL